MTNEHLIPSQIDDGWTLDESVKYFQLLDDLVAMNKAIRLRNLVKQYKQAEVSADHFYDCGKLMGLTEGQMDKLNK